MSVPRFDTATGLPVFGYDGRPAFDCGSDPPIPDPTPTCCYAKIINGVLQKPTFIRATFTGYVAACFFSLPGSIHRSSTYNFNTTLDLPFVSFESVPNRVSCIYQRVQAVSHTTTNLTYNSTTDCSGSPDITRVRTTDQIVTTVSLDRINGLWSQIRLNHRVIGTPIFGDGGNLAVWGTLTPVPIAISDIMIPTHPFTPNFFTLGSTTVRLMGYQPC